MKALWVSVLGAALLAGCLPGLVPDPPATGSDLSAASANQDVFHDPVLLTGGAGLILTAVGAIAGLVACQTENCIGQVDTSQASSPQVQYGYPVMAVGLAVGLPLYIGAWIAESHREEAQRRQLLMPTPVASGLP